MDGEIMDRRDFIASAGALSLATAMGEVSMAAGRNFDPVEQSIAALQTALNSGAVTAEALTALYLERIARFDHRGPEYRSVLTLNPNALAMARTLDEERKARKLRGPLHGIPIILKDNIETADPIPTTAGSLALARSMRGDAPLAANLRAAGAVILAKSNLSEWANFRSTRSCSGWSGMGGQTRNAYARDRNPSGSSSGSAVATALSFCAGAIGTETNGSILSPSSLNGLVGFKPTVGVVSGKGVVPITPRQDTAGPMCRTVADAILMANVIAQSPLGFGAHGSDLEAFRLRGVRIGVMPIPKGAHPGIAGLYSNAKDVLEKEGAVAVDLKVSNVFDELDESSLEVLLFEFKVAINDYLSTLDASQVPSRTLAELIAFNQAHADRELIVFGQEIFEMAQAKGPLTDPLYQKHLATLGRAADIEGLAALLGQQGAEVLMAPSAGPAGLIDPVWGDQRMGGRSPIAGAAAIAGYPSITVPAGLVSGLPVGITLVTHRNQDGLLLQVARAYERAANARIAPRPPA
jgi:amidase